MEITKITDLDLDYLRQIKQNYREAIRNGHPLNVKNKNKKGYMTLQHGTSTKYLASILKNGLLPAGHTGINNWKQAQQSTGELTYLTSKWAEHYAANATTAGYNDEFGEGNWQWDKLNTFACILNIQVPLSRILIDEDAFLSKFMQDYLKEQLDENYGKETDILKIKLDPIATLNAYGTATILGKIPADWIHSFEIQPSYQFLYFTYVPRSCQYMFDFETWQNGITLGEMSIRDKNRFFRKMPLRKKYMVADLPPFTNIRFDCKYEDQGRVSKANLIFE